MRVRALLPVVGLAVAACGSTGPGAATAEPWVSVPAATDCDAPIAAPTLPDVVPGYTEVDPATGLHVTGTAVEVDPAVWRLEVSGMVERPLHLTYGELRCLPKVQASPALDCPGYFTDHATWAGVPLQVVLAEAGISPEATWVRLVAADGYYYDVELLPETLASAFLAYEVNGQILPVLHGFPARFVWPGHEGWHWVKWLVGIEVY